MTALTHKENELHNRLIVAEFNLGQAEEELRRLHEENKALRARLAQLEPEPVAWMYQHEDTGLTMCVVVQQVEPGFEKNNPKWQKIMPLYTAPPQREWQGLTDEELREVVGMPSSYSDWNPVVVYKWLHAIEAKLKEKNHG